MYSLNQMIRASARYVDRSEYIRRFWITFIHAGIFIFSAAAAFLLRFEFTIDPADLRFLKTALVIWVLTKILTFQVAGLNQGWWRFVSLHDLARLALGNTV